MSILVEFPVRCPHPVPSKLSGLTCWHIWCSPPGTGLGAHKNVVLKVPVAFEASSQPSHSFSGLPVADWSEASAPRDRKKSTECWSAESQHHHVWSTWKQTAGMIQSPTASFPLCLTHCCVYRTPCYWSPKLCCQPLSPVATQKGGSDFSPYSVYGFMWLVLSILSHQTQKLYPPSLFEVDDDAPLPTGLLVPFLMTSPALKIPMIKEEWIRGCIQPFWNMWQLCIPSWKKFFHSSWLTLSYLQSWIIMCLLYLIHVVWEVPVCYLQDLLEVGGICF